MSEKSFILEGTDDNLALIAQTIEPNQLHVLDLSYFSDVTDAGLQIIARFTNLTELHLDVCMEMTDKGLQHLAELTELKELNLSWFLVGAIISLMQAYRNYNKHCLIAAL